MILESITGEVQPRKRGKKQGEQSILTDLSGNAPELADIALFAVTLLYCMDTPDMFENALDMEAAMAMFSVAQAGPVPTVELDPTWSQHQLRSLDRNVESSSGEDVSHSDELSDCF